MTDAERRAAAKQFAADWKGRGDEKQETQHFWIALLSKIFGVAEPDKFIDFERRVEVDDVRTGKRTTKFIDGYIPATKVLIEQKGADIDLRKGYKQSDGSLLSPFQQARRYGGYMPTNEHPRWIVVCNFQEFDIHDMNRPNDAPEIITLSELEKDWTRLNFLVDTGDENIKKAFNMAAEIYDLSKCPLQSYNINNLIRAHELFPDLPVMLTCDEFDETVQQAYDLGFAIDMDLHGLTQEIVDMFHAAGLEVGAWTANTRAEISYCLSLGVDYIESDVYAK